MYDGVAEVRRLLNGDMPPIFHNSSHPWLLPHRRSLLEPGHLWEHSASMHFPGYEETVDADGTVHIAIDLPGVKKEDLEVALKEQDRLPTVDAKRYSIVKEGGESAKPKVYEVERTMRYPSSVDVSKMTVALRDGVLNVAMPKKTEGAPARKIEVSE